MAQVRWLGENVAVEAPHKDAQFIAGVKALGGKWERGTFEWMVPAVNEHKLADLLIEVFGDEGRYPRITFPARVRYQPLPGALVTGYSFDHIIAFVRDLNERRFVVHEDGSIHTKDHWVAASPVQSTGDDDGEEFRLALQFTNEQRTNGWIIADEMPWWTFKGLADYAAVKHANMYRSSISCFVEDMNDASKSLWSAAGATLDGKPVAGAFTMPPSTFGGEYMDWFVMRTGNGQEWALFIVGKFVGTIAPR